MPKTEVKIQIDLERLKIGDLGLLAKIMEGQKAGNIDFEAVQSLLEKIVVGGIADIPITALPQVIEQMNKALQGAIAPTGDGQGN
jgi:hypothetical protein